MYLFRTATSYFLDDIFYLTTLEAERYFLFFYEIYSPINVYKVQNDSMYVYSQDDNNSMFEWAETCS